MINAFVLYVKRTCSVAISVHYHHLEFPLPYSQAGMSVLFINKGLPLDLFPQRRLVNTGFHVQYIVLREELKL